MSVANFIEDISTHDLVRELKGRGVCVYVGTIQDISRMNLPADTGDQLHVAVIAPI